MINTSAAFVYNKQRIKMDGSVAIYLRIIIGTEKKDIPLKISWPLDKVDWKKGRCKPRDEEDSLSADYSLIMKDADAKATEIFIQYRLKRLELSMETFLKEYHSNISKESFIDYMEQKINNRVRTKEIEEISGKNHTSTLRKIKLWKPNLSFRDINNNTAKLFDNWMLRHTDGKSLNARWAHHKNFKTYINQAIKKDHIDLINPYKFFNAKKEEGRHQPLTKDQFISLWEYYDEPLIHPTHRIVLRAFLLVCLTGMRHGDLRRFSLDWIDGEFLSFIPNKTKKFGTKARIPISTQAYNLIADEIDEVGETKMFLFPSEQKQNEFIKEIADLLELNVDICFQVGRETFATLYMEEDGKLEILASFMAHTTTKQSEKYVKIRDRRRKSEVFRISNFTNRDIGQTDPTNQTRPN